MDLNILDKRLRAFEKKFRNVEQYVRSADARVWRRAIAIVLLIAGLAAAGYYLYDYMRDSQRRIQQVDEALASEYPSYDSRYCRWIYGTQPSYDECLRYEQLSFTRFQAVWENGKTISNVREQMIACYFSAQNENGISWRTAADCAELDADLPESAKH